MALHKSLFLLTVGIGWPTAAFGCIFAPPALELPREPKEDFVARAESWQKAKADEDRRTFQSTMLDRATAIGLAKVVSSRDIDAAGSPGKLVTLELVAALKGAPANTATLRNRYQTTCGMAGGGPATAAGAGEYVLFLEGPLFKPSEQDRFGFKLTDLREPRLLQLVDEAAGRLRDGKAGASAP